MVHFLQNPKYILDVIFMLHAHIVDNIQSENLRMLWYNIIIKQDPKGTKIIF